MVCCIFRSKLDIPNCGNAFMQSSNKFLNGFDVQAKENCNHQATPPPLRCSVSCPGTCGQIQNFLCPNMFHRNPRPVASMGALQRQQSPLHLLTAVTNWDEIGMSYSTNSILTYHRNRGFNLQITYSILLYAWLESSSPGIRTLGITS